MSADAPEFQQHRPAACFRRVGGEDRLTASASIASAARPGPALVAISETTAARCPSAAGRHGAAHPVHLLGTDSALKVRGECRNQVGGRRDRDSAARIVRTSSVALSRSAGSAASRDCLVSRRLLDQVERSGPVLPDAGSRPAGRPSAGRPPAGRASRSLGSVRRGCDDVSLRSSDSVPCGARSSWLVVELVVIRRIRRLAYPVTGMSMRDLAFRVAPPDPGATGRPPAQASSGGTEVGAAALEPVHKEPIGAMAFVLVSKGWRRGPNDGRALLIVRWWPAGRDRRSPDDSRCPPPQQKLSSRFWYRPPRGGMSLIRGSSTHRYDVTLVEGSV